MARRITEILVDDLDGTEITQGGGTVRFGLDGTEFEIDLTEQHASELRGALAPYIGAARKVSRGRATSAGPRGGSRDARQTERNRAVAQWAAEQGLRKPGQRGRISREIYEKYDAAH